MEIARGRRTAYLLTVDQHKTMLGNHMLHDGTFVRLRPTCHLKREPAQASVTSRADPDAPNKYTRHPCPPLPGGKSDWPREPSGSEASGVAQLASRAAMPGHIIDCSLSDCRAPPAWCGCLSSLTMTAVPVTDAQLPMGSRMEATMHTWYGTEGGRKKDGETGGGRSAAEDMAVIESGRERWFFPGSEPMQYHQSACIG